MKKPIKIRKGCLMPSRPHRNAKRYTRKAKHKTATF